MDAFRQFWIQLFAWPLVLLIFAGCVSGYREPAIPRSEMAALNATSPLWIVTIDGKSVSRAGITGHKKFRVAPGQHVVEVQYSQVSLPTEQSDGDSTYAVRHHISSNRNIPVQFFATRGTTYYVRADRSGDAWRPFITDISDPTPR
jgi:hypothetical protein